jgi:hypothetical protein
MSEAEKVHERANSSKVQERISQDSKIAVGKALGEVRKSLTERGFDASEIKPFIKEGAFDAIDDFK